MSQHINITHQILNILRK